MNNKQLITQSDNAAAFTERNAVAIQEVNRIMHTMTVPKELKGKPEEIHSLVNIAMNLNVPVEATLANCHVIHGRVGFDAKFLIAIANRSGKLDRPLQFYMDEGRNQWCYAIGYIGGHEYRGPAVTMQMATAEKWNAKWKTIPELMLQYRAAAFFIRTVMPEVLMGAEFADELTDVYDTNKNPNPGDFNEAFIEGETI